MIKPHDTSAGSDQAARLRGRRLRFHENRLPMKFSEFEHSEGQAGYRFELIEGVLHVSPPPSADHQILVVALLRLLQDTREVQGTRTFAMVLPEPQIYIDESEEHAIVPQPDLAAYVAFPPRPVRSYRGLIPGLVIEVLSRLGRNKDLVRNVEIYGRCPGILEYWVVDPLRDPARPALVAFRRPASGGDFERVDVPAGGVYVCPRWPGLRVDLSRIAVE